MVGGLRDNVTRLEMKHPHLQTSPSFAKSINGTDVCLLFVKNNAVIDLTKTTARWHGSSWKVTRPKSPINEQINLKNIVLLSPGLHCIQEAERVLFPGFIIWATKLSTPF